MDLLHITTLAIGLGLGLGPGAAAAPQRAVQVTRSETGYELSLEGTGPLHVSSREILVPRLIDFPESGRFAVVWDERLTDGRTEPWYGISLDGSGFARTKATSYEIEMRRARFDPIKSGPGDGAPSFESSRFPPSHEMHFVQFETQPIEEYLAGLSAEGARVYKFVSNHSYLVRMSAPVRTAVAALPYVRWVGPYHPEYRVEPYILSSLDADALPPAARYDIQVFERGLHQKQLVADQILAAGGSVDPLTDELYILIATLTPEQLIQVAALDEVLFIDRHVEPQPDLDIARQFSNADYLEAVTGWSGQGVRGEVMDTGLYTAHSDFQHNGGPVVRLNSSSTSHGTLVTGTVFGDGTGDPMWRGILPDATLVFHTTSGVTNANRLSLTAPLVDPGQPYQCVFQTNSWGTALVKSYNNASTVMDDIIFELDLLIFQSQSNTSTTLSRAQAWAKNVVSVGGINHNDSLTRADDTWLYASIGPAEDGRIKPDLAHFYDFLTSTSDTGSYASFEGTSAATPLTAGHAGLFFQMWHENAFGNDPTGSSVFDSAPHASTAKAALITTATQWTFSGGNHNLTRVHQGWGAADVKNLYDLRDRTFYIDQSDVIDNLATNTYCVTVAAGEPEFKATLTWPERGGTTSALQHRLNDLDLKVTEPDGVTYYWGARGLKSNMYSNSGGAPKDYETVEPVFVLGPTPGLWTIEVIAAELTDDIVPSSPGLNAVYSLWVTGAVPYCIPSPVDYCTAGTSASGCQVAISSTGTASASAPSGFVLAGAGAEGQKDGLFFWGTGGRQANPWGNSDSFQCVVPPVKRGGLLSGSGTNGVCNATFTQDLNALWCPSCPKSHKNPGAGTTTQAQLWYRDPLNTSNQTTSFSNAIEFTLSP